MISPPLRPLPPPGHELPSRREETGISPPTAAALVGSSAANAARSVVICPSLPPLLPSSPWHKRPGQAPPPTAARLSPPPTATTITPPQAVHSLVSPTPPESAFVFPPPPPPVLLARSPSQISLGLLIEGRCKSGEALGLHLPKSAAPPPCCCPFLPEDSSELSPQTVDFLTNLYQIERSVPPLPTVDDFTVYTDGVVSFEGKGAFSFPVIEDIMC